ncbi:MAG: Rrf2 family transcriptional regulator [Treponema sp.]|jgi:Rrf2 family protein|nr:Rrf2 family transcriptional regulator [Treponema sp.]
MRISTKGRYSLEALLYMALLPEGDYASTRTIAENTGISDGYLEQLFIPLRKAGIVQGIRGPQGGYLPGKDLDKITVGEILRAVEGSLEPVDCISATNCPLRKTCGSRQTWREIYGEISDCVDTFTLQDLVHSYKIMDQMEYTI